jgi:hypothetical protein
MAPILKSLLAFAALVSSLASAWDINNDNDRINCQRHSLPNNSDTYVILIASGNYREQLNVTRRGPTYLLGQTSHPKNHSLNTANVFWAAAAGTGDNAYSSVLTVAPNLNASLTGSGPTGFAVPDDTPFGCVDFRTYNLNFINDYANQCEYHSFLQTASHNLNNWEVID